MSREIRACGIIAALLVLSFGMRVLAADPWVVYAAGHGPGQGKHIVLVSGDEEYRSEEALPQLGKILAERHGFKCSVLFPIAKDGTIDPNRADNIPGLETLKTADLMIIFTRFKNLPDDQMKYIADYVDSGRPVIGMRTATHAFSIPGGRKYSRYSFNNKEWDGGFGRQVLGETWVSHHGDNHKESTRGVIAAGMESHPILRGIKDGDIWSATGVYKVRLPLSEGCQTLVLGQVLNGMKSDSPPVEGKKNDPMMPIAWVRTYKGKSGVVGRVFNTTIGAGPDLVAEGTRRMLVNAAYWAVGLEDKIPAKSDVTLVGEYHPRPFGFGGAEKGVSPERYVLKQK